MRHGFVATLAQQLPLTAMTLRLSNGQKLHSPEGLETRPTTGLVRQAVMNILAAELPDCRWLDLCSGSGAMACEALLGGASWVQAVERNPKIAAVARRNLQGLGSRWAGQWALEITAVERWLQTTCSRPFDLIYADPPYAAGLYGCMAERIKAQGWLKQGGQLLLECERQTKPSPPLGWHEVKERRYGRSFVLQWQLNAE